MRGVSPLIIPTVIMKQIEGVSNDSHKNVGLVHKSTVRTSSITRKLIFFFFPKKYLFSQEKLRLASSILEYLKPAPISGYLRDVYYVHFSAYPEVRTTRSYVDDTDSRYSSLPKYTPCLVFHNVTVSPRV